MSRVYFFPINRFLDMPRHSLSMPPLSNSLVLALTTIDTCDDINQCRTLFSIVQICLTTVFLCTWVSLHLNVPQFGLGFFACTRRRLRMLLITLIAPELMFGFAARQYVVAKWLAGSKQYFPIGYRLVLSSHSIWRLTNTRIFPLHGWFCNPRQP
jgi:hypothetical protein